MLQRLILAECLEGKGRFVDDIANGVWLICEETFWGAPAHLGGAKGRRGIAGRERADHRIVFGGDGATAVAGPNICWRRNWTKFRR